MAGLKVYTVEVANVTDKRQVFDPPVGALMPGQAVTVEIRGDLAMRRLRNRPQFRIEVLSERGYDSRDAAPAPLVGEELEAASGEMEALAEHARQTEAEEREVLGEIRAAQRRLEEARESDRLRRMGAALSGEFAGGASLDVQAIEGELEELPYRLWAAKVRRLEAQTALEEQRAVVDRGRRAEKERAVADAEEAVRDAEANLERVKADQGGGYDPRLRSNRAAALRRELDGLRAQGPEPIPA
jgi:DNA repair exonuclease SbcCD ATPase subunit